MALTPGIIRRDDEVAGQDFLILSDGSSRRIQPFAPVDDTGAHSGIAANPLVVEVTGSETFVLYSTPAAGEDSHANFGTGPCELRQLRCLLAPLVGITRYLMYFDSLTVPANGQDPIWRTIVPASGAASEDFAKGEMAFSTGLSVALSTSIDDLTITSSNEAFFQVVVAV